ncbi:hypothetical protein DFJ58DRAFT_918135 [Suillus subalutaceus]|uniref:uncharacterized protein n=1 Tax=Suillus subalutaceus TaxID=48586 RepID=UPI001B85E7A8|nr:uncharacterized protein DFJ58DRAFT_918135 [Suillus subalutaceus]KAG1832885.1 hypothetical protein DFJ58DRAFT_918135 [Suillus subalutaceus]
MTAEHISSPPIPPHEFSLEPYTNPDQLAADQDGLDDNLPRYSTQLESVSTSTSISQSLAMSPPQIAYSYSTTTMLPSVPNHGSQWNNTPNSIQYLQYSIRRKRLLVTINIPIHSYTGRIRMVTLSWSTTPSQYNRDSYRPSAGTSKLAFHAYDASTIGSGIFTSNTASCKSWRTNRLRLISPPVLPVAKRTMPLHTCEFIGTLEELKTHCKAIHFTGPTVVKIECRWEGCDYYKRNDPTVRVMRRDTIWRHIYETHLRLKRGSI